MLEILVSIIGQGDRAKMADCRTQLVHMIVERIKDSESYVRLTAVRTMNALLESYFIELVAGEGQTQESVLVHLEDILHAALDCDLEFSADFFVKQTLFSHMGPWIARLDETHTTGARSNLAGVIAALGNHFEQTLA